MSLLRPVQPRLNNSHPLSRYCVGAWFFGDSTDVIFDLSPYGNHATFTGAPSIPFTQSPSPYGPALDSASGSGFQRYTLGSITSDNPISLYDMAGYLVCVRLRYTGVGGGQWARIIDKSSGGSASGGWALTYNSNNNGGLQFYANGTDTLETAVGVMTVGNWYDIVVMARVAAGASVLSTEIFVNGERENTNTGGSVVAAPATTTDMALLNWNHTSSSRAFVGEADHIAIYAIRQPGIGVSLGNSYFFEEDVDFLLRDIYGPFRPPDPILLFTEPAAGPPPSEFEPHRMFLAGD